MLGGQVKEVDIAIVVEDRGGRLSASWRGGGLTGGSGWRLSGMP